jgi:hypothetical protein
MSVSQLASMSHCQYLHVVVPRTAVEFIARKSVIAALSSSHSAVADACPSCYASREGRVLQQRGANNATTTDSMSNFHVECFDPIDRSDCPNATRVVRTPPREIFIMARALIPAAPPRPENFAPRLFDDSVGLGQSSQNFFRFAAEQQLLFHSRPCVLAYLLGCADLAILLPCSVVRTLLPCFPFPCRANSSGSKSVCFAASHKNRYGGRCYLPDRRGNER